MAERSAMGPDLVIAGAARCGTSTLAAHLARHPNIDMGMVKEPNYFSRYLELGPEWYDGLFAKRTAGLLRLDGSTSYTYPQFPNALARLAEASPHAFVVYSVRDPLARAVSHYLYYRHYFRREPANDFGEALRTGSYYTDVGDYAYWLPRLRELFASRLLVVPFGAVTQSCEDVVSAIYHAIDLPPPTGGEANVEAHRNNVVEFRAESVRLAVRSLRRNGTYLRIRSAVGPHRVRRLRSMVTRRTVLPTVEEALASCDEQQLKALRALQTQCRWAVQTHLIEQDARRGLDWSRYWAPSDTLTGRSTDEDQESK